MDESTRLSTVAIVVALLALFIALGQLLQQYFGTADGYRRCKDSVIGPWGKFTWLHWLLKEVRFETVYTTPEIVLLMPSDSKVHLKRRLLALACRYLRKRLPEI